MTDILGKEEFQEVYIFTSVLCANCQSAAAANGLVWGKDLEFIKLTAKNAHKEVVIKRKAICATPKLIIAFNRALMSNEFFEEKKAIIS